VLPIFLVRKDNHKHRLIIDKSLQMDKTGCLESDIVVNTQKFVSILGDYFRKYPSQYAKLFWLDKKYFKEFES
jgi:lauroyl/myristoyl acyltransferase